MTTDTTIKDALAAYDAFLRGDEVTETQKALADRVSLAAAFGAEAYERGIDASQGAHAMVRSTLLALVNPMHPDLDYLRANACGESAEPNHIKLHSRNVGWPS